MELLYIILTVIGTIIGFVLLIFLLFRLIYVCTVSHYDVEGSTDMLQEVTEVKFLQYNVFWRPLVLHLFRTEYKDERYPILANSIQNYDICTFNEAFQIGNKTVQRFVARCKLHGLKYVATPRRDSFCSYRFVDSGLLLLSRYPIIETDTIYYKAGCSYDTLCAKGALYAKIRLGPEKYINVFTTHLNASYGMPPREQDLEVRQSQMAELNVFIRSKIGNGYPTFIMGDFNVDARHDNEYQTLRETLPQEIVDFALEDAGEHPVTFGVDDDEVLTVEDDRGLQQRLDYILVIPGRTPGMHISRHETGVEPFRVENQIFHQLSDHYAVNMTVLFGNGPTDV